MQPGQYIIIKVADIEEKIKYYRERYYREINSKTIDQNKIDVFWAYLAAYESVLYEANDLSHLVGYVYTTAYIHGVTKELDKKDDYLNNLEI